MGPNTARPSPGSQIAESAAYLLSDRAAYVTGDVLVADGAQWLGKAIYTDPRVAV